MKATVERNKGTGEFACMLEGLVLAKGKSGPMVSRVYDMAEAVNMALEVGVRPMVATDGRGAERRFSVLWGDAVLAEGMGAVGAYRILDGVEGVLEAAHERPGATGVTPVDAMGGATRVTADGSEFVPQQ